MTATNRVVILWRLRSSPTTAAFLPKMHCLLLLLLGLLALASLARGTHNVDYHSFNKRGPVPPSELCGPGGKGNGDIVCAPTKDNNYTIPNVMRVAWNSADGEVASINAVDIYLRRMDKVGWVGSWPNIPNEDRIYDIQLSASWFPERQNNSEPQTLAFQIVIVPNEKDPNSGGPGTVSDVFYITRPADLGASQTVEEASTTTKLVTSTPNASSVEQDQPDEEKKPSTALVVASTVSGVLALAAIIAVIIACKSRRRLKKQRSMSNLSTNSSAPMMLMAAKEDKHDAEFTVEVSSIHSTTPLATKESVSTSLSSMASRSNLSSAPSVTFSSAASQNVAISPSDASILSDAFRHALRKPDWENENNDDDEDDDDESLNEEERRRRKEAKQLMKMELAQEGTGLQTVQRRPTHVQIRKPSDGSGSPAGGGASDDR